MARTDGRLREACTALLDLCAGLGVGEALPAAIIDAPHARDLPAAERAVLSHLASSKATLLASLRGNRLA